MFGRFFGRKAVETKFLVEYVVFPIIVGLIIVLLVFTPAAKAVGERGYRDELCRINVGMRSAVAAHSLVPLLFCGERAATVDANNWNACDSRNKKGWKASNDIKRCAEQQLFNAMSRCWYMYGESSLDFRAAFKPEHNCFAINVRNLGKETINEETLTNFMNEQKFDNGRSYCSYIGNNRVGWATPACGSADSVNWETSEDMKSLQSWRIIYYDECSVAGIGCPTGTSPDYILIRKA